LWFSCPISAFTFVSFVVQMPDLAKFYNLLTLCACSQGNPVHYDRLRQAAEALPCWETIPNLAEVHGLAPLVYVHLGAAKIVIPETIERELRARYMQHNHANRVRTRVLAEILEAFEGEGIDLLVLKGMAMAHLVYPHHRLRPMTDIDLLVSKSDAGRGQNLLAGLGFRDDIEAGMPSPHHMPIVYHQVKGVAVCVELHHNLNRRLTPETSFEALRPAARPFRINDTHSMAYTLSYADLLAHTYNHMVDAPFQSFRLIWIADMISLVERFSDQIDWDRLPTRVTNALKLISWLAPFELPLSEEAESALEPLPVNDAQLRGWPFSVIPAQSEAQYLNNISEAFRPSAWWLRLYYGLPHDQLLLWVRSGCGISCISFGGWLVFGVLRISSGRPRNTSSAGASGKRSEACPAVEGKP